MQLCTCQTFHPRPSIESTCQNRATSTIDLSACNSARHTGHNSRRLLPPSLSWFHAPLEQSNSDANNQPTMRTIRKIGALKTEAVKQKTGEIKKTIQTKSEKAKQKKQTPNETCEIKKSNKNKKTKQQSKRQHDKTKNTKLDLNPQCNVIKTRDSKSPNRHHHHRAPDVDPKRTPHLFGL